MRRARPRSRVHTDAARPYSTPFAHCSACSSSLNRCTVTTGPNTSLFTISASGPGGTTTVGSYQEPAFLIRPPPVSTSAPRSEEHTSELQSLRHLVCRLLLEKKKKMKIAVF